MSKVRGIKANLMRGCNLFFLILFFFCIFLLGIILINKKNIYPTNKEIPELKNVFGDITINDTSDILVIQHRVIDFVKHEFVSNKRLDILANLKLRKGFCYDRSLILQKIFAYNNIKITPIYIYFNTRKPKTSRFDFFTMDLGSHNTFEVELPAKFKFKKKIIINTSKKMIFFYSIEEYISLSGEVPRFSRFILHLNNRNGKFLSPSFFPDIY